jgi:hypothetical protein
MDKEFRLSRRVPMSCDKVFQIREYVYKKGTYIFRINSNNILKVGDVEVDDLKTFSQGRYAKAYEFVIWASLSLIL